MPPPGTYETECFILGVILPHRIIFIAQLSNIAGGSMTLPYNYVSSLAISSSVSSRTPPLGKSPNVRQPSCRRSR